MISAVVELVQARMLTRWRLTGAMIVVVREVLVKDEIIFLFV